MVEYMKAAISNGNPAEQALIRRWWHEVENAEGRLVWEYYLDGRYVDAIWFPDDPKDSVESDGKDAPGRFSLRNKKIILCEAKLELTPELIGQALVYSTFALNAHGKLGRTVVFAETGSDAMRRAAKQLGLWVVIGTEDATAPEKSLL